MNSIFTKQEESLLAGLGFTFQPIKRSRSRINFKETTDEGDDKKTSCNIYDLYGDLISKQTFNPGNLHTLFMLAKQFLESNEYLRTDQPPATTDDEPEWDFQEHLLLVFALLSFYINQNYVGPRLLQALIPDDMKSWLADQEQKAKSTGAGTSEENSLIHNSLVLDGEELVENIQFPIIIVIVEKILDCAEQTFVTRTLNSQHEDKNSTRSDHALILWWKIRTWFLHQQFLEERSQELFNRITQTEKQILTIISNIEREQEIKLQPPLQAMFYVELSEIYLHYYDIEKSKNLVELAKNAAELKASPAGALGRRTKHQQSDLAQLVLHVELTDTSYPKPAAVFMSLDRAVFPQNVLLDDDVRLEQVKLSSATTTTESNDINPEITAGHLTPLQHLVLLADFRARSKYLPKDGVYNEELLAYLQYLIEYPKLWCVQFLALFRRSLLETDQRRTVERSMNQLQSLKTSMNSDLATLQERVKCFFGSGLPQSWEVEDGLGKVLISLGLYKEALDIALRLSKWEDVISCYNLLNLRHKAEEVIRGELSKNPEAVKLWIYLGDATDNVEYYEKAWNLSKSRSSRAQRQWGNYHFSRKEYEESIEHFQRSVELNPLEHSTWIRLGFASLQCEKWDISTRAYQHATELDSDNFELWNNLANGFLKSGNKTKALRAFHEAVKCNYENWKVWDNLLVVATDCKVFEDVLRAYNRLIDLKTKWEDEQVLTLVVHAIVVNMEDSAGNASRPKYLKDVLKLFGRITSSVRGNPTIWKLYSDLQAVAASDLTKESVRAESPDDAPETHLYNSVSYMERAIKCSIIDPNWNKLDDKIKATSEFVLQYIERIAEFQKFQMNSSNPGSSEQLKNDAQFLIKKVFNAIKQTHQTAMNPEPLQEILTKLQEEMKVLGFHME